MIYRCSQYVYIVCKEKNFIIERSEVIFIFSISKSETSWGVDPLGICAMVIF